MNNGKKEIVFTWFIENYSYCWHRNGESLFSPQFTSDDLEGGIWNLELYPRGCRAEDNGYISLCLYLVKAVNRPETFPLKYELSFLAKDGSPLLTKTAEFTFETVGGHGFFRFLNVDQILLQQKADYLPKDTLSVRCRMWKSEGNLQQTKQINARTRIGIEQISLLHVIEGFSTLKPNQKETIQIRSLVDDESTISSSVYVTDDSCSERKVMVEIKRSSTEHILTKYKISLLDTSGIAMKCGEADNRYDTSRRDISKLSLTISKDDILSKKSEYLSNDKLSLMCECVFSSGVKCSYLEKVMYQIPYEAYKHVSDEDKNIDKCDPSKKLSGALDDLKVVYNDRFLTDVELKTKTKSFLAHKIVLCARSPVFKAMMSNDMKEKNTDCIKIDDLDDKTVQQFLFFFSILTKSKI